MNDQRVAKRYAQALALLADHDLDRMRQLRESLDFVCETIYQDDDLCAVYTGVQFTNADKKNIIRRLFSNKISEEILHFLLLLIDKMRAAYLVDIQKAYHAILDEAEGISDATVYSAFDLTDEESQKLAQALGRATGKTIRLATVVEPELLAGLKIQYGDYVIDGSAKARLEQLRKELTQEELPTEVRDR